MDDREKNGIGLNIGSLLPWVAIPILGPIIAALITKFAGFGFWQILPLRGITVFLLRLPKLVGVWVRFAQPAWNATTLWAHLRGRLGSEGMPTMWQDLLFFPGPEICKRRFEDFILKLGARDVDHYTGQSFTANGLVEIHPGLQKTPVQLVHLAKTQGVRFVKDTRHLRRAGRESEGKSKIGPWREALEALLPYTELIHVQAIDGEEWRGFIDGEPTELAEMLQFIRDWGYDGPFVVEYDPRATGPLGLLPWILAKNLRRVRERIEEQLA